MINLTEEQLESLEKFQSNKKGLKALQSLFSQKKEERIKDCMFAKNKDTVIKGTHKDIIIHETAESQIKGNLEFIEGMKFILECLSGVKTPKIKIKELER